MFLYLEVMIVLTLYMNSLFNPILYIIRNTRFKKELAIIKSRFLHVTRYLRYYRQGLTRSFTSEGGGRAEGSVINRTDCTRATKTSFNAVITFDKSQGTCNV